MIPMKRVSKQERPPENPGAPKRPRIEADQLFDDDAKQIALRALEKYKKDDTTGWIMVKVFMAWPQQRHKKKVQVTSVGEDEVYKLDVEFRGDEVKHLDLEVGDIVKLSVRGASTEQKKRTQHNHLPLLLCFDEGFSLLYKEKKRKLVLEGTTVDTWKIKDDWFLTPANSQPTLDENPPTYNSEKSEEPMNSAHSDDVNVHDKEDVCMIDLTQPDERGTSQEQVQEQEVTAKTDVKSAVSTDVDPLPGNDSAQALRPTTKDNSQNEPEKTTKPVTMIPPNLTARSTNENRIVLPVEAVAEAKSKRNKKRKKKKGDTSFAQAGEEAKDPALELVAGFKSLAGIYSPLKALKNGASNVLVAGVVTDVRQIAKTSSGDWSTCISIVDPSNMEANTAGFKVNCFSHRYKEWLPTPVKGHVLLVRKLKIGVNKHNLTLNGTGYPDKFQWAAFDPARGIYYHTPLPTGVPREFVAENGFGPSYTPFFDPDPAELAYCVKLNDWYRAIQHQWSREGLTISVSARKYRDHMTIGEAKFDTFFDTTVEILSASVTDDWVDLLVTDYTINNSIPCSSTTGQHTLKCSSAKLDVRIRKKMTAGSFWSLKNIRLKYSDRGFPEIDLFAADCKRAGKDPDTQNENLKNLLQRKMAFQLEPPPTSHNVSGGEIHPFLISEVIVGGSFTLVVELLSMEHDNSFTDIYVTDYTANANVVNYRPSALRSLHRDVPVFRIGIYGKESHITNDLALGGYYALEKVLIMHDGPAGCVKGRLFNADTNIKRVRSEDRLAELLSRKKLCLGGSPAPESSIVLHPSQVPTRVLDPFQENKLVRHRHEDQPTCTITQIKNHKKLLNKFRLVARIEDFYPLHLVDFAKRRCKNCHKVIPANRRACTFCEDMAGNFVEWLYEFFFRVSDETGESIIVSVHEEANIFLGLEPSDLKTNTQKSAELERRLRPLLGNLIEVHEGIQRNENIDIEHGPFWEMAIASWYVKELDTVVYGLTGCELVTANF